MSWSGVLSRSDYSPLFPSTTGTEFASANVADGCDATTGDESACLAAVASAVDGAVPVPAPVPKTKPELLVALVAPKVKPAEVAIEPATEPAEVEKGEAGSGLPEKLTPWAIGSAWEN